ncbi:hypothetical protein N5D66_15695 [Delftia tsuruhatensis]|jgi:heme-degrading monooxygenase HmoA|uniref:ABM domain-containing protein n=2 Tax=Delftia TaxID=80865 RepID=A0A7T2YVE6_9BURK|nr:MULTISPECIES: hypothetical protein [Delftia]EPD41259.1 hypothetical protein HMPREF9702_03361 [Delftia acidovorans CCUG 15835]KAA9177675.1 hypothetical protein F3K36_08170 [Delftia sp. BR1]MDH0849379.1 hypothetical protein [Delftia tsuruhatensis]QPS82862.1 hypothetical protein I6G47_07225 [Delftia lacustris]
MIMALDFIQSDHPAEAVAIWNLIATYFSGCDGFDRAQLVKVDQEYQTRSRYAFASLCKWSSASAWIAARDRARQDLAIIEVLHSGKVSFFGHTMRLIDGDDYVFSSDTKRCILLDVIYITNARVNNYKEMWNQCNAYMRTQPGYVKASLYQNQSDTDEVKFINIAEWNRTNDLIDATHTNRFSEIVADFKDDFALYFSHRLSIGPKHLLGESGA